MAAAAGDDVLGAGYQGGKLPLQPRPDPFDDVLLGTGLTLGDAVAEHGNWHGVEWLSGELPACLLFGAADVHLLPVPLECGHRAELLPCGALARLRASASGNPAAGEIPPGPTVRDLRDAHVDGRRSITFQMGMGGMMGGGDGPMSFTFDGEEFDADRIDQQVRMGTVEEWTIGNDSPMDHPFHLHVWPMQLLETDGSELSAPVWLDVVNVPARSQVKVRVAFADFGGRTVYHCHILDHEDRGMMGTVLAN